MEKIELDFSPEKVLAATKELGDKFTELSRLIEESMGKQAPKSIHKLEEAAEKGTSKIGSFFSNLGHRVKEDMKTAFDATRIMAGANFAEEIGKGIKSVFDLEQAFARLNSRLKMGTEQFSAFKSALGTKAAATGQKTEDVLPGVEVAAARGGVTNAAQLADIGGMLGQVKAATGEGTEDVAESVVDILKSQQKDVTADNFKQVLDALQGARAGGAFKTAAEAGQAVSELSKFTGAKLSIRDMAALSAQASQAGEGGQGILQTLLGAKKDTGEQQRIAELTGRKDLYKGGKLNPEELGKIDLQRLGLQKEMLGEISGLGGSGGSDFVRFVETFKKSNATFEKVAKGSNETADQFSLSTDNLKSKIDRYRESVKEAGRQVGEGLSGIGNALLKGDLRGAGNKAMETLKAGGKNWEALGSAALITGGVGMLAGGGLGALLKKAGGGKFGAIGGLLGSAAGTEAAKASGITPVYVTNASEISGGMGVGGAGGAGALGTAAKVLGVGALAYGVGQVATGATGSIDSITGGAQGERGLATAVGGETGGQIYDAVYGAVAKASNAVFGTNYQPEMDTGKIAQAVKEGASQAKLEVKNNAPMSQPSAVTNRGGKR